MADEKLTLFPYQEEDVQRIVDNGGTALIASDVGGAKTVTSIEAALRLGVGSVLVIAPKGTHKRTWERTILRQAPNARVTKLDSTPKGKQALADLQWNEPGWYICTPQWFARQMEWKNFKPDMAIFDELHIAGNYSNKTAKKLLTLKAKARIGMSGTPLRNKFENAWMIVRWVYPEYMPKPFYQWRITDCEWKYSPFAVQNKEVTGERNPGQLVNSLPVYIRHKQRERCCDYHPNGFLEDLEEPEEIVRTVQMSTKQKKFYRGMEEHYVAWLSTPDPTTGDLPVVASLPIVARGMLRFCALGMPSVDEDSGKLFFSEGCESPKLTELFDVLEDMGDQSAIVFTHSQQFARETTRRLNASGINAFEWSGKSTQRVRDGALERFIAGEIRIVVAVISAVGTGTDGLQEATNVEIWLSEDDDGTTNEQGRGRLDRPGQTHKVVRVKIQAEGTMDEGIVSKQLENALRMSASLKKRTTS